MTMAITGYVVYGQDNDSYAFRDEPAIRDDTSWYELHQSIVPNMSGAPYPGFRRCAKCGELLAKWDEPLTGLRIKKSHFDISATYDGVVVVSDAFRAVYDSNGLGGLRFIPLLDHPAFSSVQAMASVEFDAERRGTRFVKQCFFCGRYESVVGATPVFLKECSTIPDQAFVRTDLEFGSNDEKHPLLLCGPAAGRALKNANLKGLDAVEF
jgi:hypothetical protein